jgi:hypothetical protein
MDDWSHCSERTAEATVDDNSATEIVSALFQPGLNSNCGEWLIAEGD